VQGRDNRYPPYFSRLVPGEWAHWEYYARMDTLLLSKHEAARLLGLSVRSLEHLISRKEIPTRRIGRRVLITRSAIESFARAQNSNESPERESL